MPLYVFALMDAAPSGSGGRGLNAAVTFRRVTGVFAAVERRADVPPIALGSLTSHQRIVERLAARVPAILPVRFGTLLTPEELQETLEEREDELTDALDLVRGRRQMTWRLRTASVEPHLRSPRHPVSSGTEYLQRAKRATTSTPSPAFRSVRERTGRLAIAERHQQQTSTLPESLYHLIDNGHADEYLQTARDLRSSTRALTVSGPWAPYAFVPDLF
jgi:hypothetical protein